ncbi:MAG TPA: ferredoxin--NADP reductase [Pyrinomonadaceae bacterium]|jgi:ferredoxin/flavodoxin---NADP+ reductase|nr:ferredoxin--NADP reductase [Pyrinomonadaceae bacterium]
MPNAERYSAELIQRMDLSERLAVFRFRVAEHPTFISGQFATIGINLNGEVIERPYSIVSSPFEPFLEFFIELVPEGDLTPRLWELKLGSRILIRPRIVGQLTLAPTVKRHLMMATLTGIAPFVSILRTQEIERRRGYVSDDRFLLIHGTSQVADFGPYLDELRQLAQAGSFTYVPTVSRPWQEPYWKGETGRVEDIVRKHADTLGFNHSNSIAYACGHPRMVENVKDILARAGFQKDQIKEEEYFQMEDSASHIYVAGNKRSPTLANQSVGIP